MADVNLGNIFATLTIDGEEFRLELADAEDRLSGFQKTADSAFSLPRRAINLFTGAIGGVFNAIKRLVTGFFSLRTAIITALGAITTERFAELGSQIDNTQNSFNALVNTIGASASFALGQFRQSVRGTVSDLELMQTANQALVLGVVQNVDELEKLGNAARRLGQATGRTATEGIRDLVTGIGRASPLILDNLGITIKVGEANNEYARSLGKLASELTDAEKRTAFQEAAFRAIDDALLKLGDDTETFGDKLERIRATFSNFTARIVSGTIPSLGRLADALSELGTGGIADRISEVVKTLVEDFTLLVETVGPQAIDFFERLIEIAGQLQVVLSSILRISFSRLFEFIEDPSQVIEAVTRFFSGITTVIAQLARTAARIFSETFLSFVSEQIRQDTATGRFFQFFGFEQLRAQANAELRDTRERTLAAEQATLQRGFSEIRRAIVGDTKRASEGVERLNDAIANIITLLTGGSIRQGGEALQRVVRQVVTFVREFGRGNIVDIEDGFNLLRRAIQATGDEVQNLERRLDELQDQDVQGVSLAEVREVREQLRGVQQLFERLSGFEAFVMAVKERIDAIRQLATAAEEAQRAASEQATETADELDEQNKELERQLRIEQQLREAADTGIQDLERVRQVAEIVERNRELVELLEEQGIDGALAQRIRRQLSERLSLTLSILSAQREQEDALEAQEEAARQLREEEQRRARVADDLTGAVEQLQRAAEEEFADAALVGLSRLEQALTVIDQEFSGLRIEIEEARIGDDVKARLLSDLQDALDLAELGVRLRIDAEAEDDLIRQFDGIARRFGEQVGRALARGEDPAVALATAFASAFEQQFSEAIGRITEGLGSIFRELLPGGGAGGFGSFFGGLAGFGLFLGAQQLLRGDETSVNELPIDEIATSTSAVRGVVAGPQSVAIAEVGSSIREANRGVERLLTEIRDILQSISLGSTLDPTGVGAAGTV